MNPKLFYGALLAALACLACRADTVYLTDGTEASGTIIEENANTVVIRRPSGTVQSYRRKDVDAIVYDRKAPAAPAVPVRPVEPALGAKKPGVAKTGEAGAEPKEGEAKAKPKETAEGDEEKEEVWTPPPGLSNFPDHAKRMKKDKEQLFMDLLKQLSAAEQEKRDLAKAQIGALGTAVLPYAVAGCYDDSVEARAACMKVIGEQNGRNATKQVIEVFYAAMPDSGQAEDFQIPFIRAAKETLIVITGQSFITVEPDMPQVQDGLKQYVEWYNKNMERLPPQLGEGQVEPTDPDYMDKIKSSRVLKLAKKSWPRPRTAADEVMGTKDNNRPNPTVDDMINPSDKAFRQTVPTVKFDDFFKR
jgi:hypothetical protein